MQSNTRKTLKQLTLPHYQLTKNDLAESVSKEVFCLCTELRLDQREIAVIGIRGDIKQRVVSDAIKQVNTIIKDYKDSKVIKHKRVKLEQYDVIILYKQTLYLKVFEEVCNKKSKLSPELHHYIFTKLFGYSARALESFLNKWVYKK